MVSLNRLTSATAVRKAIAEFDRLGRDAFLRKYGFGRAKQYFVVHGGNHYDSKAIVGAAIGYQTGTPLRPSEFSGGVYGLVPRLDRLGFSVVALEIDEITSLLPEELSGGYYEGDALVVRVNRHERSVKARTACVSIHGTSCVICGFDFGVVYGSAFQGHIHVHHLSPVARSRKRRLVDPKKDLIPVCPNCHAAIHFGGRLRKPAAVRLLLSKRRAAAG